jgi:hypothetical protein
MDKLQEAKRRLGSDLVYVRPDVALYKEANL